MCDKQEPLESLLQEGSFEETTNTFMNFLDAIVILISDGAEFELKVGKVVESKDNIIIEDLVIKTPISNVSKKSWLFSK